MIAASIAFALLLVLLILVRPRFLDGPAGRLLALAALVALPLLLTAQVGAFHLEHAKRTRFCLACHEMAPFGADLRDAGSPGLAAAHFQNHWVSPEQGCHTCHTDYAMHGDLRAKVRGLQHVWAHYVGPPFDSAQIDLYEPYANRNCLHCHGGARRFEEAAPHDAMRERLADGRLSCLGCHRPVHAVRTRTDGRSAQ